MRQSVAHIMFSVQGTSVKATKFGEFLRGVRRNLGMTQVELAKRCETLQHYVSNLETGFHDSPSINIMHRMAIAMGYSINIEFVPNDGTINKEMENDISAEEKSRRGVYKNRQKPMKNRDIMRSFMLEFLINKGKCHICGKRFTKADPPTLDHVIAASREGTHEVSNAAAAHGKCNSAKNANRTHLI